MVGTMPIKSDSGKADLKELADGQKIATIAL